MNNRKWTDDTYKNNERIECSILINITERVGDEFKATFQIQYRRPVFNTSYNSIVLDHKDNDIQFRFLENQTLDFNDNGYVSEMTSLLGFYAYLIVGLDYDSFALKGGTTYLQKCLAVANYAQSSASRGWKAFDSNGNRYWLINNMLDASFIPLRECMYIYHRKGMDIMFDNKEMARKAITESIEGIRNIHQIKPLSFSTQVFFNSKFNEIIEVFSVATEDEKTKIVNTLNLIDPTRSIKYQKIVEGK
jgi:hypothetical protein